MTLTYHIYQELCDLECNDDGHTGLVVNTSDAFVSLKVKEADLYSAFIEVPYTQGAQVRITQCYLKTTPYLPLPRKHSPDGASQTEVADI